MADTLAVDIRASLQWLLQETLDLTTISDASKLEYRTAIADGDGAGEADRLWHDTRTIGAGLDDDLDLSNLQQTIFGVGVALSLAKVKAILLVNLATTSGDDLLVGGAGAANDGWGAPLGDDPDAVVHLPADSALLLVNKHAGWDVSAGVADVLRIHNPTANSIDYRIAIIGVGA